jgi:AraC family transcriptional regulator
MQLMGIGRVIFWEGGSLWLARITSPGDLHIHHAMQISLALDGEVLLRPSQSAEWVAYAGAVITPDLPHAFDAPGLVAANILFEPESVAGRALLQRYSEPGIAALSAAEAARLVAPIRAAHNAAAGDDALRAVARQVIAEISGTLPQPPPADSRVLKAIAYLRDHIDEPITLATLADVAGLSPSRMRHLFVSETGIAAKSYVLWERLNHALELGFGGLSWTEAAHAANFSDSAHLTRTCRRMFGLVPTAARIE